MEKEELKKFNDLSVLIKDEALEKFNEIIELIEAAYPWVTDISCIYTERIKPSIDIEGNGIRMTLGGDRDV